jgi:hypothetical protein
VVGRGIGCIAVLGRVRTKRLVIGLAVTAAIVGAATAVTLLRGGGTHRVALYDPASGGAEGIVTGIDRPMSHDVRDGHALVWNLDGDAAVVDLSTGSAMRLQRDADGAGSGQVSFAWPPDSPADIVIRFRAYGTDDNPTGEVVAGLIDQDSGTEIDPGQDVDVALPTIQRLPDGSAVAFYDQRGDQTLIFDLLDGDEVAVAGSLLAVGTDVVATRAGEELHFFDPQGELLGSIDTAGVVADVPVGPFSGFTDDGTLWFVDSAGSVYSAVAGGGGVVTHATGIADAPRYLAVLPEAERVAVVSDQDTALVSLDGAEAIRLPGTPVVRMPTVAATRSWRCLGVAEDVSSDDTADDTAGVDNADADSADRSVELRVVDAATGDVLNHATGSFRHPGTLASDDGCTIAVNHDDGTTNMAWVIDPDGAYEVEGVVSDLAADGSAVMVSSQEAGLRVFDLTRPEAVALRVDADVAAFTRR